YEKVGGMGQARSVVEPRIREVVPLVADPTAARSARAVNDFLARAAAVLAGHPVNARRALRGRKIANALLVRNAGGPSEAPIQSFSDRYGFPGAAVTEMPVERGIARVLHLEDLYVGPMGPDRDRSLAERARVTRDALDRFPFVYVHLKGPDEPGHDGNAPLKREIIEALDRSFFGPFLDGLDLDHVRLAVTADHATPCILKGHSDDPVPLILAGAGILPDRRTDAGGPRKFGEASAALGSLGTIEGKQVLALLAAPDGPPA
ncbi:MAG: phosphonopyruvate decarboxylase, partial [Thermoplasmata archaeon]|nr:phosphonopyruvate decarboxylase [Thermoplasmata archaeon]